MPTAINTINAKDLWKKINSGEPHQIVDVREPDEYSSEHIAGSISVPLSGFNDRPEDLKKINSSTNIYLLCKAGRRAQKAAEILSAHGKQNLFVINGGLTAWIEAGCPVDKGAGSTWSIERQVRFIAGFLVILGIVLAVTVSPNWILLPAILGCGMMISAATNICGMAMLLARLPWNKGISCSTYNSKHV